jgi:hypothetical protein
MLKTSTETEAGAECRCRLLTMRLNTAVRLTGLSRSYFYRRARTVGDLRLIKAGNKTLVRLSDLERVLDSLPLLHPAPARSPEAEGAG